MGILIQLSLLLVSIEGSGLAIVFIERLLLETTNQYNTLICFHTTNHSTLDLSL
jgi:hypothetical protein